MKSLIFSLFVGIFVLAARPTCGAISGGVSLVGDGRDVLMQGFTSRSFGSDHAFWKLLIAQVPDIAASGATMIWLPPSADSVDGLGYLTRDWYNQNCAYGREVELRELILRLKTAKVRPVADIVVDHRCGDKSIFDFQNPLWTDICDVITVESNQCGRGTPATGSPFQGAPTLNHRSAKVQADIISYLRWMRDDLGYEGFRWDSAKGFSPVFVKQYLEAAPPYFSVGEFWDGDAGRLERWVNGTGRTSGVFDYSLKYVLNRCMAAEDYSELSWGGKPAGLMGVDPSHAVTFIENHDTETGAMGARSGNYNNAFPEGKELEGYAILLTHPGIPTLFYGHYFGTVPIVGTVVQEQTAIQSLIKVRRRNGIWAQSAVDIKVAMDGLYAALIDGKVAVKVGPVSWEPAGKGWSIAAQGHNYTVWEKS